LLRIIEKWDLHAVVVGQIIGDRRWRARWKGELVADIPVPALNEAAPLYDRPAIAPKKEPSCGTGFQPVVLSHPDPERIEGSRRAGIPACAPYLGREREFAKKEPARESSTKPTASAALRALLASPNVCSRRWVYRQYDWMVGSNTIDGPGGDAALLRIKGTRRGLALTVDSNPRACTVEPYLGTVATVCEAVRNVACTGARPAGITNCLNYGNPERPEIMWQFVRGVEGLRDAALAFDTPVISGNVSFYNETEGRAIPPTPTIAVVGMLDDAARHLKHYFKSSGDSILMIRTAAPLLVASEYAALFGQQSDEHWNINLDRERRLVDGLVDAADRGLIRSAHDVSEGGLAVALAEACFNPWRPLGANVSKIETDTELFGEGPSTVIVSAYARDVDEIRRIFEPVEVTVLGRVTAEPRLTIAPAIDEDVNDLMQLYEEALPRRLGSK
jgi:phosphoribosylformylglycinamidine synthase